MNKPPFIVSIKAALGLCVVFLFGGLIVGRIWQYQVDNTYTLTAVAIRLNEDADWQKVRDHVYCNLLSIGMERSDVEKNLALVGPYTQHEDGNRLYYSIFFDEYFVRVELGDLYLAFDDAGHLVEKMRWTNLGDTTALVCS